MLFEQFILALKNVEGLGELDPDSEGRYSLRINRNHLIHFSPSFDHQDLFLYASIGYVPLNDNEKLEIYDKLLSANMFGKETGRCFFALDQRFHQLLLTRRFPLHSLSKEDFIIELPSFMACLTHWKQIVDTLPHYSKSKSKHNSKNNNIINI